ncbi:MAG: MFS transporter [Verrucomicrobia bacterium]|nr:MFS transporter [Verrucomicrobiota bacterium]
MWLKIVLLYAYSFLLGLSWTTIPALSTLLTSSACEDLESAAYGGLMMALVICAILSSISAGTILLKYGMRKILLSGVVFALSAVALLYLSEFFIKSFFINYTLLLGSQCLLGLSIGMSLTALNVYIELLVATYKASFFVAMYACLGLGSTFAPIYFDNSSLGCHWEHKMVLEMGIYGAVFMLLLKFLPALESQTKIFKWLKVKDFHFWLFAVLPFFYGIMEESITVWGPVSLFQESGWTRATSELGLTYFWGSITFFQVFIAALCFKFPSKWIYYSLSLIMGISFYFFSNGSHFVDRTWIFAFAGMGFSAFYSLTVHLGEKRFPNIVEFISGAFVCAYMIGGAISAFGIGILRQYLQFSFSQIYGVFIILAFLMCALSIYLQKYKSEI